MLNIVIRQLHIVCKSEEFKDVQLRNNEKKILNTLNKDKNRVTIRLVKQLYSNVKSLRVNYKFQNITVTVVDFLCSHGSMIKQEKTNSLNSCNTSTVSQL